MYPTQVIVTLELSPEDYLYLSCLTNDLTDCRQLQRLSQDYRRHQDDDAYINYLNQLARANGARKGEHDMVCEGLFELFGTSSEEIASKAEQARDAFYQPQIEALNLQIADKNNMIADLRAEIERLRKNQN